MVLIALTVAIVVLDPVIVLEVGAVVVVVAVSHSSSSFVVVVVRRRSSSFVFVCRRRRRRSPWPIPGRRRHGSGSHHDRWIVESKVVPSWGIHLSLGALQIAYDPVVAMPFASLAFSRPQRKGGERLGSQEDLT